MRIKILDRVAQALETFDLRLLQLARHNVRTLWIKLTYDLTHAVSIVPNEQLSVLDFARTIREINLMFRNTDIRKFAGEHLLFQDVYDLPIIFSSLRANPPFVGVPQLPFPTYDDAVTNDFTVSIFIPIHFWNLKAHNPSDFSMPAPILAGHQLKLALQNSGVITGIRAGGVEVDTTVTINKVDVELVGDLIETTRVIIPPLVKHKIIEKNFLDISDFPYGRYLEMKAYQSDLLNLDIDDFAAPVTEYVNIRGAVDDFVFTIDDIIYTRNIDGIDDYIYEAVNDNKYAYPIQWNDINQGSRINQQVFNTNLECQTNAGALRAAFNLIEPAKFDFKISEQPFVQKNHRLELEDVNPAAPTLLSNNNPLTFYCKLIEPQDSLLRDYIALLGRDMADVVITPVDYEKGRISDDSLASYVPLLVSDRG